MAVYIDNFPGKYRNMKMCHMVADTRKELLDMVDKIGVKREWIQDYDQPREHFDISETKKKLAIRYGAVEINMREMAEKTSRRGTDWIADEWDKNEWLKYTN